MHGEGIVQLQVYFAILESLLDYTLYYSTSRCMGALASMRWQVTMGEWDGPWIGGILPNIRLKTNPTKPRLNQPTWPNQLNPTILWLRKYLPLVWPRSTFGRKVLNYVWIQAKCVGLEWMDRNWYSLTFPPPIIWHLLIREHSHPRMLYLLSHWYLSPSLYHATDHI